MRLESALFSSREGLNVHGQAISVVGDNISNSNTDGFKAARIEFSNLLETGSGVQVQQVRPLQVNGTIESTGRDLDVAIDGSGFFIVGDTTNQANQFYTRNGAFSMNEQGLLVDGEGRTVLGYGTTGETLGTINLLNVAGTASATTTASLQGNIDASLEAKDAAPNNPATFAELNKQASFTSVASVYDSLGTEHSLLVAFTKTGAGQWVAQGYMDGGDVTGGTAGVPKQVGANVTLNFNTSGGIDAANQAAAVLNVAVPYSNGSAAGAFPLSLAGMTQFSSVSQLSGVSQDGIGAGSVKSYRVDSNGSLFAEMTSNNEVLVGRLPLATFANVDGLKRIGSNLFQANTSAGAATVKIAGQNGAGELDGAALERSTTDLAQSFIDLVLYQRGYQASSQALSTANQLIQNTISLIR